MKLIHYNMSLTNRPKQWMA